MMHSIRSKILVAFAGLGGALLAMTLFSWADLRFVERQIGAARQIDGLREQIQEMRRHEKNALLYRQADEARAAVQLASRQLEALNRFLPTGPEVNPALSRFADPASVAALRHDLLAYRELVGQLAADPPVAAANAPAARSAEDELRRVGHRLSTRIDDLAATAAERLGQALGASQRAQLYFALSVLAVAFIVAVMLVRVVARPLRELERNLKPLAEGRFDSLPAVSDDREMVSLTQALSRMLDELERRRRQVLQAEKLASLGVLAAGVAHELNNPLGNVSAAAQILREELGVLPVERSQWLNQIDTEVVRAQGIVQRLLDYAQRKPQASDPVVLAEVVGSALSLLGAQFPAAATVALEIPGAIRVLADRQRLQQVFINLIGNALASTVRGVSPRVRVIGAADTPWAPAADAFVVGVLPLGSRCVTVCVSDDGAGIPRQLWPRVFDPFFTTREPGQGVGLGLFVVAEIVQESGGSIAVDASDFGGARFCLAFPAQGKTPA
jgi:signal transduction histidine kinase